MVTFILSQCWSRVLNNQFNFGHLHFEPPSLVEIVLVAVLAVLPILFIPVIVVASTVPITEYQKWNLSITLTILSLS